MQPSGCASMPADVRSRDALDRNGRSEVYPTGTLNSNRPCEALNVRQGRTDYRMQRRVVLRDLASGARTVTEVCDAHPDLVRAGIHIGTDVRDDCPVCDESQLKHVSYVFEDKRRTSPGGRAVPRQGLAQYAQRHGDLRVYTVEVCVGCRWHHLVESFQLLARPRRQRVISQA